MNSKLLIVQCGEMSAISNNVIANLIDNAKASKKFSEIYGAIGGLYGIIDENIADLTNVCDCDINSLKTTPGCVLATAGGNLSYDFGKYEYTRIFNVLSAHNITHMIMLCDKGGVVLAEKIVAYSVELSHKLAFAVIPVSSYNDVKTTSFNLGYRTAAKFVATNLAAAYADIASHTNERAVMIFETPELHTGWLSIATSLASFNGKRCSALTFVPEFPFNRSDFVLRSVPVLENESNVALTVLPCGATNEKGTYFFPKYDISHDNYGSLYKHELSSYIAYTARENLLKNVHVFESNDFLRTSPYVLDSNDIALAERSAKSAIDYICADNTPAVIDTTSEKELALNIGETAKEYNHVTDSVYDPVTYKVSDKFVSELENAFGDDVHVQASYKVSSIKLERIEKMLPEANIRFR